MRTERQKKSQKAQGMVEFALVLPLLLLMILAIFAFGHFLYVYIATVSASREAVRYGAALGVSENGVARFQDCQAIRAAARRVGSVAGVSTITITYDDGANLIETCTGNTLANPANVGLGDRLVVEVITNYSPIVPFVNIPSFPIRSRSVRTIYRDLTVGNAAPAQPVNTGSKTNTTLVITSDNPDYSKVGAVVDVYYTLSPSTGSPIPTGNVTINGVNGTNTVTCTATIAAGHCTVTPNAPGVWTFTANYAGDANFNASTDTESHQVYYFTTVSITNQAPASTVLGSATNVVVTYLIATDPAVTGTEKPVKLQIGTGGTVICDIASPSLTGTCTLPAFTSAGTKTINIDLPAGDPNFLEAHGTATHEVSGGIATTTVITGTDKNPYTVGDSATVNVQVTSANGPSQIPTGTVTITTTAGTFCTVTLAANGTGSCTGTLTTRGTTGEVAFTASYPGAGVFTNSTSAPYPVTVNKAPVSIVLVSDLPDASGVNQAVTMLVSVSPVSGSIPLSGTVKVSVVNEAPTCTLTLTNGQGSCSLTFTTSGQKSLLLEYSGDSNFAAQSVTLTNAHTVTSCPTISAARWIDSAKKVDAQMIFQLSNPNPVSYRIEEVNASWPPLAQTLYVTELQVAASGGDATDWSCDTNGNKHPPYCLWTKSAGLTTVFGTAAYGQACQGAGVTACESWINIPSISYADPTIAAAAGTTPATRELYFVLSSNAPRYYAYSLKVRLSNVTNPADNSCQWITADFSRP